MTLLPVLLSTGHRFEGQTKLMKNLSLYSLDSATQSLIDEVVRTWFKDWTVLAIAHKLDSILDYDRVAVLEAGCLVEFDEPRKLLTEDGSVFRDLYLHYTSAH